MLKIIILFFILNFLNGEGFAATFYPFGIFNGDTEAPKTDDKNMGPIRFNYRTSFKYFDNSYSSLYINPNV